MSSEEDTLWTKKLRKLQIHLTSRVHNEIAVSMESEAGEEVTETVDEFESEGEYRVVRLPRSAWKQAKSSETGAAMTGMLLTTEGEPRTFSRTWEVPKGSSNAPEMHPGLDMVFYAEADWDWERVREEARASIQEYIDASFKPEFAYEWHVLHRGDLDEQVDWFVYWARNAFHAFVKPDPEDERAFDPERTGARPGLEYVGTWAEFRERVENGDRWPGSNSKYIAVDREPGDESIPGNLSEVFKNAV